MPVFNEDVSHVFEAMRVIFRSVEETKKLEHFDFFILSDSNRPNQWIQEEVAWVELCKQVGGFGKTDGSFVNVRRIGRHRHRRGRRDAISCPGRACECRFDLVLNRRDRACATVVEDRAVVVQIEFGDPRVA